MQRLSRPRRHGQHDRVRVDLAVQRLHRQRRRLGRQYRRDYSGVGHVRKELIVLRHAAQVHVCRDARMVPHLQRRAEGRDVLRVAGRVDHAALSRTADARRRRSRADCYRQRVGRAERVVEHERRHLVGEPVVVQPRVHIAPRSRDRPVEAHVLRQVLGHRRRFDLVADVVRGQTAAAVPLLAAVVHLRGVRLVGRHVHDDVGTLA